MNWKTAYISKHCRPSSLRQTVQLKEVDVMVGFLRASIQNKSQSFEQKDGKIIHEKDAPKCYSWELRLPNYPTAFENALFSLLFPNCALHIPEAPFPGCHGEHLQSWWTVTTQTFAEVHVPLGIQSSPTWPGNAARQPAFGLSFHLLGLLVEICPAEMISCPIIFMSGRWRAIKIQIIFLC